MSTVFSYVAISDQHGHLPPPHVLPEVDFLFIVGDFCPPNDHSHRNQALWCKGPFQRWLRDVPARNIVGCAGNHDFLGQTVEGDKILRSLPWTYLRDETVTIEGIKIHGSPWTPTFNDWAFMKDDWALTPFWEEIPKKGLDVLMTHGPPFGILDLVERGHVGSESLAFALTKIYPPQVHLTGHLHDQFGAHGGWGGLPLTVNVSFLDDSYRPTHSIFTATLEKE